MENCIFNVPTYTHFFKEKKVTTLKNKTCQSIQIDKGHIKGKGFWFLELRFEDELD